MRNIILIVLDTVRARNLSCFGYPEKTTPFLDTFCSKSSVYTDCITQSPWTLPSHASLFTGLYTSDHGCWSSRMDFSSWEGETLAESLKKEGYYTCGISCNRLISRYYGFDRGFDTFIEAWNLFQDRGVNIVAQDRHTSGNSRRRVRWRILKAIAGLRCKKALNLIYDAKLFGRYDKGASRVTDRLLKRALRQCAPPPFFLFLNLMEAHDPYDAPGAFKKRFADPSVKYHDIVKNFYDYVFSGEQSREKNKILESLYNGEIYYLDSILKRSIKILQSEGLLDDTVLIITSDHGENIGDHHLLGHHFGLQHTLLHVPLIMHGSGIDQGCIQEGVEMRDIYHTILEIAESRMLRNKSDGYSLFEPAEHRTRFAEYISPLIPLEYILKQYPQFNDPEKLYREVKAAYRAGYKLERYPDGEKRLYHIESDPDQHKDIRDIFPDRERELEENITRHLSFIQEKGSFNISAETHRRLSALGYM